VLAVVSEQGAIEAQGDWPSLGVEQQFLEHAIRTPVIHLVQRELQLSPHNTHTHTHNTHTPAMRR
jgi:hypothetical protein